MATPKRYQVFVSSTFIDLVDERRAVMQALLEQDCIPAGMELFLASDQEQWDLITAVIDDCDYYVVIIGARYGSLTEKGVSYTEKEYDYAVEKGLPVLGFVHADPGSISIDRGENSDDGRRKLDAFTAKVMTRPVRRFASVGELAGVVGASVSRETRRAPGVGWVRGDQAMTPETQAEISDLRARIAELELGKANTENESASLSSVTSDLAHGHDEVAIEYMLGNDYMGFKATHSGSVNLSWDEIFEMLGPLMIGEANENSLKARLNARLLDFLPSEMPEGVQFPATRASDVGFDRIKVQLRALRLIEKGVNRRPISDRQTYWRLTDLGDRHLASLLAIRRPVDTTEESN